jgi:hypothetical protein
LGLMKMILLSSLLCLGLGFFLGRSGQESAKMSPERSIVRSERKLNSERSWSRNSSSRLTRDNEFQRLIQQTQAFPGSEMSSARLNAWILHLEAREIPGALAMLLERERVWWEDEMGEDAERKREISDEMSLLLARWYELEGENVLGWIRDQNVWDRKETLKAEISTITDGFHRNPQRGFELSLEWIGRANQDDGDPFSGDHLNGDSYRDLILFQVGRWGVDPVAMMKEIDFDGELRIPYEVPGGMPSSGVFSSHSAGFPVTPRESSKYTTNPAMAAFAEGLVNSGRISLARELVSELEGGAEVAFDEELRAQAEKLGWREVKRQIDFGAINSEKYLRIDVVNELALQDRKEGIAWFLSLPNDDESSRAEVIDDLVSESKVFQIYGEPASADPFDDGWTFQYEAAENFLHDLERRGEPVGAAWKNLTENLLRNRDWKKAKSYRKHLSSAQWLEIEEDVISNAISPTSESFGGVQVAVLKVKHYGMGDRVAQQLGLLDQVHAKINETNADTRVKLQKLLDNMTDAQTR